MKEGLCVWGGESHFENNGGEILLGRNLKFLILPGEELTLDDTMFL